MANPRVRLAACALLAIALWYVQVIDARAQQYNKQYPQQSGMRPQSRQSSPQNKTANQSNSQSSRVAARTQPAAQAKPQTEAGATSIEKLDPEKRAAFL